MNYAVILAGGIGSRFWPLSRDLEPKQFLNICSTRPMVDETANRISSLIKKENIYIATNKLHVKKIKNCLRNFNIPLKNVLSEPESKNTLAPIAFLSSRINKIDPDAVIVILPCDHIIKQKDKFLKLLKRALDIAKQGYIVTLGVHPKRPETGYGYIKIKSKISAIKIGGFAKKFGEKIQNPKIYKVDKYIEKPGLVRAKGFIKDKRYYWNSGIFIFRADVILDEIKKFMPNVHKTIADIKNKKDLKRLWHKLPSLSVDYAIMEKTKRMALLPADYGWLDIGSWQAIEEILKKDKYGNIFRGNCISIENKNTLIWSDKRLVAALGLKDIIIVNTKDALLVCSKDKTQDVKKVVQILKQRISKN